jgi:signal transduction histidine kinase/DNA-binding response OmpR family regulator
MTDTLDISQVMTRQELLCSKLHLLIVEDMQADIELMAIALESAGIIFTYDAVETLDDCQQLLATQAYNAVLSDHRLPGFTAYQVLHLLEQSSQEIPLILVTGNLGEEAAVDCIKAGMTDYVLKQRLFRLPMVLFRSLQEFELRRQQQQAVARIQIQAQQEAIVNRITGAMRGTLVLDEVLQTTADMLHETLKVSRCLIFQSDSQGEMTIHYASNATEQREQAIGMRCRVINYYKNMLALGNQIFLNRVDQINPQVQLSTNQFDIRAVVMTPLMYQQNYLGGICLHQCDREREWTDDELSLIKTISDQCAIAIHQAQLFSKVQQQATRERTLNQISQTLNSSLDPEYILHEIVRLTGEYFGVDRLIIFSVEAEQIQVLNEWRSGAQIFSMLHLKMPKSECTDLLDPNSDFYCRRCFHAPDYAKPLTSNRQTMIEQGGTLSVLSVPIFIHDRLFGGIGLHTTTTYRTFTDDEIYLLQQIAEQAAIALYNAQSFERLEELVKQRTQELEQEKLLSDAANRAKSEFLSTISHELRTPLTGILGFSGVLQEEIFGSLNTKQKKYVDCINSSGKHLLELINDLLDFTKIEAGKEELNLENVVLDEVGQACLSLFGERCLQRGLQLSMAIAPDVTTCIADRRRLKQILVNLLSNAVKFTDSGSITLKVEKTTDEIQISVIDTGIGIALADQESIFKPFHQVDSGLNRKYEGTGLGLALSRKLAQLHKGDITLDSELGRGSCFTVHLPISRGEG